MFLSGQLSKAIRKLRIDEISTIRSTQTVARNTNGITNTNMNNAAFGIKGKYSSLSPLKHTRRSFRTLSTSTNVSASSQNVVGRSSRPTMFAYRGTGSGKRFIAEMSVREYSEKKIGIANIAKNVSKGVLLRSIGMAFRFSRHSARLVTSMFTFSIAMLGYFEYKMQQIYKPGWISDKFDSFKNTIGEIRDKSWFGFSPFSRKSGNNDGSDKNDKKNTNGNNSGNEDPQGSGDNSLLLAASAAGVGLSNSSESGTFDGYEDMQDDVLEIPNNPQDGNVLMDLTKRLLEIQTLLKSIEQSDSGTSKSISMQLPSIVVIGSQSSGKSSVLEAIVGQEFLPKGNNMVTRRPIELTLIHEPGLETPYGEFPALGLNKMKDFKAIQRTLVDLNNSVPDSECVSDRPIELRIHANNIPDLRLVDLPGYIQITNRKQPEMLKHRIRMLCEKYLVEPNIILAVCAADVDLANSEALLESRRIDPLGMRTIGIITKVDTVEPREAVRMLSQSDYPLHLGYVGVICKPVKHKSDHNLEKNTEVVLSEARYFQKNLEFRRPDISVGVGFLRKKLVNVLEESMSRSLSGLVDAVQADLEETKYEIKVQYNDERITAESYMTECIDIIKQRVKQFKQNFGKTQVRSEIQKYMDSRIISICEELYWNDPRAYQMGEHVLGGSSRGWLSETLSNVTHAVSVIATAIESALTEIDKANVGSTVSPSNNGDNGYQYNNSAKKRRAIKKKNDDEFSELGRVPNNRNEQKDVWSTENDIYWDHKLDRAASMLVKSGIGRNTTKLVVDLIMDRIYEIVDTPPFSYHPDARNRVVKMASEILRSKYMSTVEQVENTIKPFKYEIEYESRDWDAARASSIELLDREIEMCKKEIKKEKSKVSKRQLNESMKLVKQAVDSGVKFNNVLTEIISRQETPRRQEFDNVDNLQENDVGKSENNNVVGKNSAGQGQFIDMDLVINKEALRSAVQVISLQNYSQTLQFRKQVVSSSACAKAENKKFCMEVFLELLSQKLAYSAVLFINYELLQDFFFEVPRNLDVQMYNLYRNEAGKVAKTFANQNPKIKAHLALLERKERLENVMERLARIVRAQNLAESYKNNWEYK
ncbi:hypothetical protein BB558_003325 [Smittium angustum]|uniref:dynamin GTPase n=1 Tax=Smittium angustum TaxID=133377 RepID=A0A2U1J6C6_SMIAN|nr:hypothetical protein BB558_003325 [Smittium angustum]